MGGAIFETAAVSEIYKTLMHRGIEPEIYFWRTSAGSEVDIVVEFGGRLVPIEIKLSSTPRPAMASSVRTFLEDFGEKAAPGYVLHTGDVPLPLGSGVTALPFTEL
jgi:predicted AAA+ superfamily ATPase